jgi:hypothetical protein
MVSKEMFGEKLQRREETEAEKKRTHRTESHYSHLSLLLRRHFKETNTLTTFFPFPADKSQNK